MDPSPRKPRSIDPSSVSERILSFLRNLTAARGDRDIVHKIADILAGQASPEIDPVPVGHPRL